MLVARSAPRLPPTMRPAPMLRLAVLRLAALLLAVLLLVACRRDPGRLAAQYAGDSAGARALAAAFLDPRTDRASLSLALQPTAADYRAVFASADVAARAAAHYAKLWRQVAERPIGALPSQTELRIWSATTEELQAKQGRIANFPGGYRAVARLLRPGLRVYRWKYVIPGKSEGMAYDGLYHVNGRWILVPKPWQFLREH